MLRYLLLTLGLITFSLLIWHVGPGRIYQAAAQLGPLALCVILIPSVVMYAVEAYGWKVTLGPAARAIPFWRLLIIRSAGEVVNMTTPTAYMGGEPLKAYLLKRHHIPIVDGLASVVIAKTTMTVAEVVFILVGIALAFWIHGADGSSSHMVAAGLLSVGLLMVGTAAFVVVQRQGLFMWVLNLLRRVRVRIEYLEAREEQLKSLDATIVNFYRHHRLAFFSSAGLYFLGWIAEAFEVFVIVYYLGGSPDILSAVSIGALSVFIKGGTFFIPGSLGAQDAGNLLLLTAFGYSDVIGVTFALLRRFREAVWIAVGLMCLAAMGTGRATGETSDPAPSGPSAP